MYLPQEIIVLFVLISIVIYTMPTFLLHLIRSPFGKLVLIALTIAATLHNRIAGILVALLFIYLTEFNYAKNNNLVYEGYTDMGDGTENTGSSNTSAESVDPSISIQDAGSSDTNNTYSFIDSSGTFNGVGGSDFDGSSDVFGSSRATFDRIIVGDNGVVGNSAIAFRAKHCKDGKAIDKANIATFLPKLLFKDNKTCDPCDKTCEFSISDSNEQIYMQGLLTPKNSSQ
jgi:hypothetical protein